MPGMVNAHEPYPSTRPPSHPYDHVPLTVLSGVGRSGTTIVREALSRHPDLDSTNLENNMLLDVLEAAHRNCTIPARRHAMRVADKVYDAHFRSLVLRLLWPRPRHECDRPTRLLAYSNLMPDAADYLVRLFHNVRIIYIVRNGIEVISSRMRFEHFRHKEVESHCSTWCGAHDMARWGEGRREFLMVRHEWLAERNGPDRMMGAILPFLGLRDHAPCVEAFGEGLIHPTSDRHAAAIEAKNVQDALRERAKRWRSWSDEERAAFTSRCAKAMAYFGYEVPWDTSDLECITQSEAA